MTASVCVMSMGFPWMFGELYKLTIIIIIIIIIIIKVFSLDIRPDITEMVDWALKNQ